MRNLYGPKINPADYALSVSKGGTGRMNLSEAADALQLVKNSAKGQPNGPVALGPNGQIDAAKLPALTGTNQVNLQGVFAMAVNTTTTWKITDYDSFKTYELTASAGTISRSGDTITFVAPGTTGNVNVSIGGRAIVVSVTGSIPTVPSITSPVSGTTGLSASVTLTGSAFGYTGNPDTHAASDWQLATDAGFTSLTASTTNDTVNKTSWAPGGIIPSSTYYARVRYKGAGGIYSDWSAAITFSTKADFSVGTEEAKIIGTGMATADRFATALSFSADGSRLAIGAYSKNSSDGAVYIFSRSGSTWTQEAAIPAVTTASRFGRYVAMSGDGLRVAIHALMTAQTPTNVGRVYVYSRSGTTWSQEQTLNTTSSTANGYFGGSLSLSNDGSRICIGAPGESSGGNVYIFLRTGVTWALEQKIQASGLAASGNFGVGVSMTPDATRFVAGADGQAAGASSSAGMAYIYSRSGTVWNLEAAVQAADPVSLAKMGTVVGISADGTRVVAGALAAKNASAVTTGAAYVFLRSGTSWAQDAKLLATGAIDSDAVGSFVGISSNGGIVYASAPGDDTTTANSGGFYVFTLSAGVWSQTKKVKPSTPTNGQQSGWMMALSANDGRVAIGNNDNAAAAGAAYVFV